MSHEPSPDPHQKAPEQPVSDESLDVYFDRLDAALATRDTPAAPEAPGASTAADDPQEVPTLNAVLAAGAAVPPAPIMDRPPSPPRFAAPAPRSIVADAFAALLAAEQGKPAATPVRLTPGTSEPVITDALVDELTRRVIERLAPDVVRDLVAEVLTELAERLVREEIERIRSRQ